MKAQEKDEKTEIKLRYATALLKALQNSHLKSFRQFAMEAGMEPAHMQLISTGQLDVALTTSVALANALNIPYSKLATYYDEVTDEDVLNFKKHLEKQKARYKRG